LILVLVPGQLLAHAQWELARNDAHLVMKKWIGVDQIELLAVKQSGPIFGGSYQDLETLI
jgi:hypothetical protein